MSDYLSRIRTILPSNEDSMMELIPRVDMLKNDVLIILDKCIKNFYSGNHHICLDSCSILLDYIWEKLNTGYWKDVDIVWRYAYTSVSILKASSQFGVWCCEPRSSIALHAVIKTCDMGILMGAPVMDNILARIATIISDIDREVKSNIQRISCTENKTSASKDAETESLILSHQENIKSAIHVYNTEYVEPDVAKDDNISTQKDDIIHKRDLELKCSESIIKKQRTSDDGFVDSGDPLHVSNDIEHCSCPSLETFRLKYMEKQRPVVITDAVGYWPAMSNRKWTLDYLRSLAGDRTVPIELGSKYTEDTWSQSLMTMSEFIEKHIENPCRGNGAVGYLAQYQLFDQIPELHRDISVPSYCSLGECEDVVINAWFGPKGTISPLHHDPKHNLLVQVVGDKYIRVYSESVSECLYPHPGYLLQNTSQVDLDNPDYVNFPKFRTAPYMDCVLKPGEMLYMPPRLWHYVRSLSVSFSVSFWFE